MKKSQFIGRQLSRLRMAQSYYNIITSTVSVVSLIILAFNLELWILVILFLLLLFSAFFIGYIMDKLNIHTIDYLKTNEMNYRFLSLSEIKVQEFWLLQTKMLLKALKSIQENKLIKPNELLKKYQKYYNKWKLKE